MHLERFEFRKQASRPYVCEHPAEFDPAFYAQKNADLTHMSETELRQHFFAFGQNEGRIGSLACLREHFIRYAGNYQLVLEIGPFCNPALKGVNVRYFDVLDAEGLAARAVHTDYQNKTIPEIHYVSPIGDLSVVGDTFPAVFGSHNIEHHPDLIYHLNQVETLLADGGYYYLIIPDKRYCFDHFIAESTIAQVIDAHMERRRTHRLCSIIEHRALTTHNDPMRHWRRDHVGADPLQKLVSGTQTAIEEYRRAQGGYVDVHAWQFTPESFRNIVHCLGQLNFIRLSVERVYNTPFGRCEFTAILKKEATRFPMLPPDQSRT